MSDAVAIRFCTETRLIVEVEMGVVSIFFAKMAKCGRDGGWGGVIHGMYF
jgi:hypothetical protein